MRFRPAALLVATFAARPSPAHAEPEVTISLADALGAARTAAPDLEVARAEQGVARAEVGVAGTVPNPTAVVATSTQTARFSGTVSIPLVVLGQRAAAVDAARAEERTTSLDAVVAWIDVRQATERAYVTLWLTQAVVEARRASAAIQATLEAAVAERVRVGAAPELDSLRVHAERLRAEAEVADAEARVDAAASELARWTGMRSGARVRAADAAPIPAVLPGLPALLERVDAGAPVQRERADALAADARGRRERALVRPGLAIDVGADFGDPTLNYVTNYRAQLSIGLPLFNQRGAFIERERAAGDVARARERTARARAVAQLSAAYRLYESATRQERALADGVVPASQSAARATEEAYALGRAPVIAVLDAERALVDARLTALEARAARAMAWADVEHAVGEP